jgi:hypothetical protein
VPGFLYPGASIALVDRFQINISILPLRYMQLDRLVSGVSAAAGLKSGQFNRKRNCRLIYEICGVLI